MAKRRAFQRYTRVLSSRPPSFVVRFAVEWAMRRASSSLRTLPDFLIVGAQRAGTTSLYNYLAAHPAVVPALKKETLFFANYYYRGTGWYRAHFPLSSQARDGRDLRQAQHVTGEASPYYLFHPLAPARAARTVPDAHIIAILRNPVERAYSHYHHEVEMGFETLSFEEAIEHEEERLSGEEARLLRDDRYSSLTYQNYSYLARGIYVDQLVRWVRCFCIEQVLVLSSKDLEQDPERVLAAVARFVGLPALRLGGHRRDHERRYPAMEAKTRAHLHAYFAPHNRRLYDFLGADLAWER